MKAPQPTHLNAYEATLAEAEKSLVAAKGAVAEARSQLNVRRAEEGLEPIDFDKVDAEKAAKAKKSTEKAKAQDGDESEEVPEEAKGFGSRGNRSSK